MLFIGIDLAWSARNPSGGAIIRDSQLVSQVGTLSDNAEILRYVATHLQPTEGAVIAIDAPLRVPNSTGSRACDRALSMEWRQYEAGALPANRKLLARAGVVRGEALVAGFAATWGFRQILPIPQQMQGRYLCEVFPHPAHVSLFDLPKTLKYKAKAGRTMAVRQQAFRRYQQLLASLTTATPALRGTADLLRQEVSALRGQKLKAYEDTLDAVTCAYTAAYLWHHGPSHTCIYGTVDAGHILTPPLPTH